MSLSLVPNENESKGWLREPRSGDKNENITPDEAGKVGVAVGGCALEFNFIFLRGTVRIAVSRYAEDVSAFNRPNLDFAR